METQGQGWLQLGELALAFALSSVIGLERELKMRSAGLRTCTLIGVSSALIMLVSKYGFGDVLSPSRVVVDPSRVAAQIVSGIGFVGGGLIFVRRDIARGLTTAATVWLVAAVGMAAGAGLPLLAAAVTLLHFVVVYAYTPLVARIQAGYFELGLSYRPGGGELRRALLRCADFGFTILDVAEGETQAGDAASVRLRLKGRRSPQPLLDALKQQPGIIAASVGRPGQR